MATVCVVGCSSGEDSDEPAPALNQRRRPVETGPRPEQVRSSQGFFAGTASFLKQALPVGGSNTSATEAKTPKSARSGNYQQFVDADSDDLEKVPEMAGAGRREVSSSEDAAVPPRHDPSGRARAVPYEELDDEYGRRQARRSPSNYSAEGVSGEGEGHTAEVTTDMPPPPDRVVGHEYGVKPLLEDDELSDSEAGASNPFTPNQRQSKHSAKTEQDVFGQAPFPHSRDSSAKRRSKVASPASVEAKSSPLDPFAHVPFMGKLKSGKSRGKASEHIFVNNAAILHDPDHVVQNLSPAMSLSPASDGKSSSQSTLQDEQAVYVPATNRLYTNTYTELRNANSGTSSPLTQPLGVSATNRSRPHSLSPSQPARSADAFGQVPFKTNSHTSLSPHKKAAALSPESDTLRDEENMEMLPENRKRVQKQEEPITEFSNYGFCDLDHVNNADLKNDSLNRSIDGALISEEFRAAMVMETSSTTHTLPRSKRGSRKSIDQNPFFAAETEVLQ